MTEKEILIDIIKKMRESLLWHEPEDKQLELVDECDTILEANGIDLWPEDER